MAKRKKEPEGNCVRFTLDRVNAFQCPPGKQEAFLWDAACPGLGVRARSGGSKTLVFQSRIHGKSFRMRIGDPKTWNIDRARKEARELRTLVDKGIDPRLKKRERQEAEVVARKLEEATRITFGEAWDAYVAARSREWSEAHRLDHSQVMTAPGQDRKRSPKKTKPGVLFALRDERLDKLGPEKIASWLEQEKATRPTVAARGYRLLRTCLNWCTEQPKYKGLVDAREVLTKAVRRAVPRTRPKDDCLQREQLEPWFAAVGKLSNPVARAYLQCLLLTGARPQELARLKWTDVDFRWKSMTLRDKVEGDRQIPLTPYVAALLTRLRDRKPRMRGKNAKQNIDESTSSDSGAPGKPCHWVFSSTRSETGRMGEANHAHTRAVKDAGLPHVTLHGLRRSFGTLAEWVECPVGVVAQIQGHKPSAIAEKHYRRRPLDLLRAWHEKIEGWILEEAEIAGPQESTLRVASAGPPVGMQMGAGRRSTG
ncbi:MAG: integrase family protein [Pirellulaceae bacterium]